MLEKIKSFINGNPPPKKVFTEIVKTNKKEVGKKPQENLQKNENVNDKVNQGPKGTRVMNSH